MRATRRLLYLVTFLTDFAFGLLLFAISRQLAEGGAGLAFLGMVGGTLSFAWAVSSVACGRISDRRSRRDLIRGGIALLLVSTAGLHPAGLEHTRETRFLLAGWNCRGNDLSPADSLVEP